MAAEEEAGRLLAREEGFASEARLSSSLGAPNDLIVSDEKSGWNATSEEEAARFPKEIQEPIYVPTPSFLTHISQLTHFTEMRSNTK